MNKGLGASLINPSGTTQSVTFGESTTSVAPGSSNVDFSDANGDGAPQPGEMATFDGDSAGGTGMKSVVMLIASAPPVQFYCYTNS